MLFTLLVWAAPYVQALACAYAVLRGDLEARVIAIAEAGIIAASIVLFGRSLGVGEGRFAADAAFGAAELGVALCVMFRSAKAWPLAYCAVVTVSLLTVLAAAISSADTWAYATATVVWRDLESLILVVAAGRAARARKSRRAALDEERAG